MGEYFFNVPTTIPIVHKLTMITINKALKVYVV